ncbi:MAG TPA: glycosyltransferase family 1 protein [Actinomycetota bacterium]|nr:glycosyltransferase family 1 protein [Actinomycetota bacterium]
MTSSDVSRGPVVLDVQAVQSPDHRGRGIGRWVTEFAVTLWSAAPQLVGGLLLNPALPVPVGEDIASLRATGHLRFPDPAIDRDARVYHVLSPFELRQGLDAVWPGFARRMALAVTLYDLIPDVLAGRYLADPGHRRRYRARQELVRAADAVLAISEATRRDGIERLGLEPGRVTAVGCGISPAFVPAASREEAFEPARRGVPGLRPGFLLGVGGEDDRKNLEGLVAAYAGLPPALREAHQLVIACQLTDGYRDHLVHHARAAGVAGRVVLTGYVDDATLIALYQSTALFVFPSLYEGFGLPVAEAMACGAPVVASSTSALGEITPPEGQFDPADPTAIAAVIGRALTDPPTAQALAQAAGRQPPTWEATVARALPVYERLL